MRSTACISYHPPANFQRNTCCMINADKYILVNREQYSSFLLGL